VSRYLRTYLLAVALPALLLALFGAVLLFGLADFVREDRIERLRYDAFAIALRESKAIQALLDERLDRIAAAPDADAALAVLREFSARDPLVRAAFLWRKGEGCVWPQATGATEEERRFRFRYEPLFSGVVPWSPPQTSQWAPFAPPAGPSVKYDPLAPVSPPPSADSASTPPPRGYRPWSSGDRSDLLAWTRLPGGEIAGFELETVYLVSRLQATGIPSEEAAALVDGNGTELVPFPASYGGGPWREEPVDPFFPRWRIRAALSDVSSGRDAGRSVLAVGGTLFGLLLLCLAGGGLALLRAARRERLDALRKTDFVDNVSHELKTPLSGIRLSAELLAEGRLPDGPRRDKAVRSILAESDRLDRLVSNLLDFGRLERGRRRFDLQRVDLGELLGEMLNDECRMPNGGANIQHSAFSIQHCERGLAALADPDAVRRILSNLFDNAAKYAPGAPPEVSVRTAGTARSESSPHRSAVELVVADRGPGVPPGLEEKVFERFFRADDSLARRANGSGIGLSLARGLARGMGGDLTCRPRPGGGAEFVLTLPES
jgi:signal transduction histidine kinase